MKTRKNRDKKGYKKGDKKGYKKGVQKGVQKNICPLFWTSLIFATNMFAAFFAGLYFYSLLFACLTITSLVVHTECNIWTNLVDKLAISAIFFYGLFRVCHKGYCKVWLNLGIIITFLFCVWVYLWGYLTNQYVFSKESSEKWHIIMHIIGSVGHHGIILL